MCSPATWWKDFASFPSNIFELYLDLFWNCGTLANLDACEFVVDFSHEFIDETVDKQLANFLFQEIQSMFKIMWVKYRDPSNQWHLSASCIRCNGWRCQNCPGTQHALVWHTCRVVKWLNGLLKPKTESALGHKYHDFHEGATSATILEHSQTTDNWNAACPQFPFEVELAAISSSKGLISASLVDVKQSSYTPNILLYDPV
jgi:hypothetical protein